MLQALGHKVFDLTQHVTARAAELPKPVGTTIALVKWMVQPVAQVVENQSLRVLSFLDEQLYNVGEAIENAICVPKQASHLVVGEIQRRGVVGSAADFWVEHESTLRKKSESLTRIMDRLPGFTLVSPVVYGLGGFVFGRVSQWLVERSEAKVKYLDRTEQSVTADDGREAPENEDDLPFIEAKVADEGVVDSDQMVDDEKKLKDSSEKIEAGLIKQQDEDEDEADELTKLLDAGWCLGSV